MFVNKKNEVRGWVLCYVVTNIMSPAVKSSLSATPLAPGKTTAVQGAKWVQGF